MKLTFFSHLNKCFPKGDIRFSTLGAELYDANNEMIGYIPNIEHFVLRKEYTHRAEAEKALQGMDYSVRRCEALYQNKSQKKKK